MECQNCFYVPGPDNWMDVGAVNHSGNTEVNQVWGACDELKVGHFEFEVPLRHLSGNVCSRISGEKPRLAV